MRSVVAAVLALSLAACDDEVFTTIDPILEITPEHLDFGTVELTQQAIKSVQIRNIETVSAEIESVTVVDDCDGCFVVIDPPTTIESFETREMSVRFRAVRLPIATGTVT